MAETVWCWLIAIPMFGAALSVILTRHPFYSVLSLLVVMGCLAALFVLLGAPFVAALQILLYAGAVVVLFLFVTMLINLEHEALLRARVFTLGMAGVVVALGLGGLLVNLLGASGPGRGASGPAPAHGTVESVGRALFESYLLPFELTSFLILAAIVGAVTLAKQPPPS